jgi:hypothetical protein
MARSAKSYSHYARGSGRATKEVAVHDIVVPTLTGQVTPSLSKFVGAIRNAHAAVRAALSNAVTCAITAGDNLAEAKKIVGHGHWTEFLRSCGINERTARRYLLAKSNRSRTTDLTSPTIEGAIKELSPPKPRKAISGGPPATQTDNKDSTQACLEQDKSPVKHNDIVALWHRAPQNERTKAINSIGLEGLLAALPPDWTSGIKAQHAPSRQSSTPSAHVDLAYAIPADLSIPPFLRRDPGGSVLPTISDGGEDQ